MESACGLPEWFFTFGLSSLPLHTDSFSRLLFYSPLSLWDSSFWFPSFWGSTQFDNNHSWSTCWTPRFQKGRGTVGTEITRSPTPGGLSVSWTRAGPGLVLSAQLLMLQIGQQLSTGRGGAGGRCTGLLCAAVVSCRVVWCCVVRESSMGWGGGCRGSHEGCFPDGRTWLRDPAMGLPCFGAEQGCLLAGASADIGRDAQL